MANDYVLATNESGELAVRTVSATEASNITDTLSVITRTDDGKLAVRTVGGSGGGDKHNKGYFVDESALTTAYPTAEAGDYAIVESTDTVWIWDTDTSAWKDSDQKGQVTSVNGQTGDVVLDLLPSQTGNAGKFLTTDGTDASWSDKPLVNSATGTNSLTVLGTATTANSAINIGPSTTAGGSAVSIGNAAVSELDSVAIGMQTRAGWYSVAIGTHAQAVAQGSIQIAAGSTIYPITNSDVNTFKVANRNGNFEIMSADGTIPTARLTKVNTTARLAVADWSSNTQTVSVTGMTADGVVFVNPTPANQSAYTSAGILCTAQAAGTLTFTCDTVPSADITVTVVML